MPKLWWLTLLTGCPPREFFEQGEAEKRVNVAVSPHCDPTATIVPDLQV